MKKKKNNKRKENNKKTVILIVSILLLVGLIGGSYAWLTLTKTAKKTNTIVAGNLEMDLDDEAADKIELLNAVPTKDETGKQGKKYTFILENKGTMTSNFTISIESQDLSSLEGNLKEMPKNRIKYMLTKVVKTKKGDNRSEDDTINQDLTEKTEILNNDILDTGTLKEKQYIEYTLRLWIDEDATYEEMKDTAYIGKIKLVAEQEGIEE